MAEFGKSSTPGGASAGSVEFDFDRVVVAYGEMLGNKLYRKELNLFLAAQLAG